MSSMISGSSSCRAFDSEDEIGSWLLSSECSSIDDEDDLTLLNGDEDSDKDSITFRAYIELAARLKKKYNLREASVALVRCDKIWGTMQLLKRAQSSYEGADLSLGKKKEEDFNGGSASSSINQQVPLIKYQPFQGTGNNGLPNFYLSVKSQKKIFNCPTCGKLYSERRSMRMHMAKVHGLIAPVLRRKRKYSKNSEATRSKTPHGLNQDFREPERVSKGENAGSSNSNPETTSFPCPVCHRLFAWKSNMKKHAQDMHNYDFYALPNSNVKKGENKSTPPESKVKMESKEEKEARETPTIRENGCKESSARPRRACTANASYAESTVKDEEALARTYAPMNEPKSVKKIGPSSGTKCFLCSNYFADIELHLKDYHRISRPNKVLPMADELTRQPTITEKLKSAEKEKSNRATVPPKVNHSISAVEMSDTEKKIQELYRKVFDSKREREMMQCLICLYKYADYSSVRRHLLKKMVNGIVQEHEPWDYRRKRRGPSSCQEDVLVIDKPLKSGDESRKRTSQPPGISEKALESKRRRFEDRGEGNGRDEEDDYEEEKTSDQRDTRDSSDRDSGIGISITIKKRNNSYEIVDKDNSSEDTSKEGDTSVVNDSPSQIAAPLDPKKDTSRFDPLRFSENNEHKKNDLTNNNDDNDDITIIDCPHICAKNDGLSDDYSNKDNNPCSEVESHKNQTDPIQSSAT